MPSLSWRTSPRRCIEDMRLFVNSRHWLTWPCSVVFIAVYNKCVSLLSKCRTLYIPLQCKSWIIKGCCVHNFDVHRQLKFYIEVIYISFPVKLSKSQEMAELVRVRLHSSYFKITSLRLRGRFWPTFDTYTTTTLNHLCIPFLLISSTSAFCLVCLFERPLTSEL